MRTFESIYIDEKTGEILNINKYNKQNYDIKKISEEWSWGIEKQKLTTVYKAERKKQLRIEWD